MWRRYAAIFISITLLFNAHADEGMWIPLLLKKYNEADMQKKGFKLTAEDLYSINNSSLKDAVVHFGGGCTSEIISQEGLLLTNHHCGYSQIQRHSSLENDYLKNGFWAMTRAEELPNKGLTATLVVRIEDVTDAVLMGVLDTMSESSRNKVIEANIDSITKLAIGETHYNAKIKSFYYGNEYYMFVTETFKDVRMVGAPPSSIGKYGKDTDNWMWPRHTGDFSIFRIYAGKDNKPAEYSEENVPYKPKHHFPISLKGVEEGDFTFIYGFPGRTSEYLTSYAVDHIMNVSNPTRIKMRETSLAIIDRYMRNNDELRIKYASRFARISNYWKKWIGENRGLRKLDAVNAKQDFEKKFIQLSGEKHADLLPQYKALYDELSDIGVARDYFIELLYYGPMFMRFTEGFAKHVDEAFSGKLVEDSIPALKEKLQASRKSIFKDYSAKVDQEVFVALMQIVKENVKPELQADMVNNVFDFERYGEYVYDNTIFTDSKKMEVFINNLSVSSLKELNADPGFAFARGLINGYLDKVKTDYYRITDEVTRLNRTYVQAQRELFKDKTFYPDANSTLRVSYGNVQGYAAKDGITFGYYTTLNGVMEKYKPGDYEFDLPQKLIELAEKRDYGQYAQDGELRVAFVATNHTTGGNSGSPVLDASGNLIGLNFDRTWESTMSDIMFDPDRCRNIAVDLRYVLWVVDKFAGAGHLVEEMTLVK